MQNADPMKKIRAKFSEPDFVVEIPVRRADHPYVELPLLKGTERCDRLPLEELEQSRLERKRELGDLVEEKRPPLRPLEAPDPISIGAGERSALVSEERRLDRRLVQRREIHGHEGRARARALPMDPLRQRALSRSGFPRDQHGRLASTRDFDPSIQSHSDLIHPSPHFPVPPNSKTETSRADGRAEGVRV